MSRNERERAPARDIDGEPDDRIDDGIDGRVDERPGARPVAEPRVFQAGLKAEF